MTNSIDLSTPPPLTIHTPSTPQFGFHDNYRPFSPRRSTRLAQRQMLSQNAISSSQLSPHDLWRKRTPSQRLVNHDACNSANFHFDQKSTEKHITTNFRINTSRKNKSSVSIHEPTIEAARSFDPNFPTDIAKTAYKSSSTSRKNGMLPTPAKTPVKRPHKASNSITSIARNLFPVQLYTVDELSSVPRRKDHYEITKIKPENFGDLGDSVRIKVFTDPHDRVPEKDSCPDNPFHVDSSSNLVPQMKRSTKRRKIMVPGEGMQSIEELEQRNDGLLYVFRGKKVWRKFSENSEDDSRETVNNECLDNETLEPSLYRPLARSSMKPRLLFPSNRIKRTQKTESHNTEDEEADTDIEDSVLCKSKIRGEGKATTPKTSKPPLASPPTTIRITRSKKLDIKNRRSTPTVDDKVGTSLEMSHITCKTDESSPSYSHHFKLRPTAATKIRDEDPFLRSSKKVKLCEPIQKKRKK